MELRQLSAFVAVVDAGNFSRAADRLGAGQPAISQLVRRLETELGYALFERSSHQVAVTGAGLALLPQARRLLAEYERTERLALAIADGRHTELRVGTTEGIGRGLPGLLSAFRERHPGVQVHLERVGAPVSLARVLDGSLDLAFVRLPPDTPGIAAFELWREPLVCVLAAEHPLARRDVVGIADLAPYPTIAPSAQRHPWIHDAFVRMCLRAGFQPAFAEPYSDLQDGIAAAAASEAWLLLAASNAPAQDGNGVVVRPVDSAEAVAPVSLAYRATAAAAPATAFAEIARGLVAQGRLTPG